MRMRVKNVERWKDRHGKTRYYYRIGKGSRFPMRGPEGSPEFWEDYQAATCGQTDAKPSFRRAEAGTMRWLVEQYYKSSAFNEISDGYKRTRRGILDHFCEQHGKKRYAQLEAHHLRKIRDGMQDRPGAANNLLKALRQVFKCAVNYGYLDANPAAVVERLNPKNKTGFHAWSYEEVKQFEDRHPIGKKARLALALLLYTAQRRSDVVRMGRQHTKDGWITITQQKTSKAISIPVLDELQRVIDASPVGDLTYLVTAYDRPFTANGFGNWFRKKCDEAGLPQCAAHGLRKAAAARLADIGCSIHEIMSITGHESVAEVQRYTRTAQQKRLAESVRKRIDG